MRETAGREGQRIEISRIKRMKEREKRYIDSYYIYVEEVAVNFI